MLIVGIKKKKKKKVKGGVHKRFKMIKRIKISMLGALCIHLCNIKYLARGGPQVSGIN
jgi:hypothetical protein